MELKKKKKKYLKKTKTFSKTNLCSKKNPPLMCYGGSPLRVDLSAPREKKIFSPFSFSSQNFSNPPICAPPKRISSLNKKKLSFFSFSHIYISSPLKPKSPISFLLFFLFPFSKSSYSKAIFPISNSPPKPSKERPTFLKLQ